MQTISKHLIKGSNNQSIAIDIFAPQQFNGTVIFYCQGFKSFKDWGAYSILAQQFAQAGFLFVKFNYCHNGVGLGDDEQEFSRLELFALDTISYCLYDIQSVYVFMNSWLAENNLHAQQQVIVGHSRGGLLALLSAGKIPFDYVFTINAVYSLTQNFTDELIKEWKSKGYRLIPNARTGVPMPQNFSYAQDILDHFTDTKIDSILRKIKAKVILYHAMDDETVPCSSVDQIEKSLSNAQKNILPNGNHTFGMKHPSENLPEFWRQLIVDISKEVMMG
jgi:uncharacterized protein